MFAFVNADRRFVGVQPRRAASMAWRVEGVEPETAERAFAADAGVTVDFPATRPVCAVVAAISGVTASVVTVGDVLADEV